MKTAIIKVPATTLSPDTKTLPTGNDLETGHVREEIRD
jgi:hypothetical protein